jgi:hypothetical protein
MLRVYGTESMRSRRCDRIPMLSHRMILRTPDAIMVETRQSRH